MTISRHLIACTVVALLLFAAMPVLSEPERTGRDGRQQQNGPSPDDHRAEKHGADNNQPGDHQADKHEADNNKSNRNKSGVSTAGHASKQGREKPRRLTVRYENKSSEVDCFDANGTILVPVRFFDSFGAKVGWDKQARMVTVTRGAKKLKLAPGSRSMSMSSGGHVADKAWKTSPKMRNDVALVPLRETAEALGLKVGWQNGSIMISR